MHSFNQKISESMALGATIDPVSQGIGTVTSGWVSLKDAKRVLAIVQTGVLGAAATVDAKLQQAQDTAGTGAKDITGKAITQIVKATGDNKQALINVADDELDVANGFVAIRLSLTVGAAASLVSGSILLGASYEDASAQNQTAVAQVV